jgi:hypothetical protein
MGFVVAMLAQGSHFGVRSMQWASRDDGGDMFAVNQAFKHLVEQADPGVYPNPATLRGSADRLALTTQLPNGDLGLPMRADVVLFASRGRLVLRWRRHAHVVWFGAGPDWTETVLADGVARVTFAYNAGASGWSAAWTGERLPVLVQMTLVFVGRQDRAGPPVIAAPLREPIDE